MQYNARSPRSVPAMHVLAFVWCQLAGPLCIHPEIHYNSGTNCPENAFQYTAFQYNLHQECGLLYLRFQCTCAESIEMVVPHPAPSLRQHPPSPLPFSLRLPLSLLCPSLFSPLVNPPPGRGGVQQQRGVCLCARSRVSGQGSRA
eukprot:3940809-Rhodomonas_salina.2